MKSKQWYKKDEYTSVGPDSSLSEFCLFNINLGRGSSSESSRTNSVNLCSGLKRKTRMYKKFRKITVGIVIFATRCCFGAKTHLQSSTGTLVDNDTFASRINIMVQTEICSDSMNYHSVIWRHRWILEQKFPGKKDMHIHSHLSIFRTFLGLIRHAVLSARSAATILKSVLSIEIKFARKWLF